ASASSSPCSATAPSTNPEPHGSLDERHRGTPPDDGRRLFAELILQEAEGRLSLPCTSLHRVHNRARLLRALYERLDRLEAAVPADESTAAAP
ncbi:hypothetical protein ACFYYR_24960, partial [Streptomyces sp. NPDC001922]